MDINTIRKSYIDFFVKKAGHKQIPAAPLIPTDDPTTLFTSSGMQQLVPYLKGQEHPMGTRLVDSQPCFRAEDIDEVGDNRHTTFFEMLGNWSLGDYFKEEQLEWFWEFITKEAGLSKERLHVTVFEGDEQNNIPKDEESYVIWKKLGVSDDYIHYYDATKNWWSRAGVPANMPSGEIGGPDSEIFYDFDPAENLDIHKNSEFKNEKCHVNCDCGRFLEIGNSVFMQYIKMDDGSFKPLPAQNVDFGGGLERIVAASQDKIDMFETTTFTNLIQKIEQSTDQKYQRENKFSMRVVADHIRGAAVMIAQGINPGGKMQNYFVRRLIRRAVVKMRQLGASDPEKVLVESASAVLSDYDGILFKKYEVEKVVLLEIEKEVNKFSKALSKGMTEIEKADPSSIDAAFAFHLYQSYGFPFEITQEILDQKNISISKEEFIKELDKHKQKSRTSSAGMFKGGLADNSEDVTKLHTATHLLHKALQEVLGSDVRQEGSNVTVERLRFDYKSPIKPTLEQLEEIEDKINQKILEDLPVRKTIEDKDAALKSGAMAFFKENYPEKVSVYTIGKDSSVDWYSKEFCGGPHVISTGEIGPVTIKKDKSIGAGIRRIYIRFIS